MFVEELCGRAGGMAAGAGGEVDGGWKGHTGAGTIPERAAGIGCSGQLTYFSLCPAQSAPARAPGSQPPFQPLHTSLP